jgi:hypothetical protein
MKRRGTRGLVRPALPEDPRLAPPEDVVPAEPNKVAGTSTAVCERLVSHDSLRWRCACGASGPVARSNDGIPYVTEEILRHTPGEVRG